MILRFSFLTLVFLLGATAQAQYNLKPYYEADAFVTERILPFAVTNTSGEPVEIHSITRPSPCSVMIDPYRSNVLLLRCPAPATLKLDLFVKESQKLVRLTLDGISVKKVSISTVTPPVVITPDPIGNVLGQTIYNNNCKSCHTSIVLPKNTTPAILTAKFTASAASSGPMAKFKNFFTAAELTALSKYINGGL